MDKHILLVNPFKSVIPRKLLQMVNSDNKFYLTEAITTKNISKLSQGKKGGVAIWFFSRDIQLKKHFDVLVDFCNNVETHQMRPVLITSDKVEEFHDNVVIIPVEEANEKLKSFLDEYFDKGDQAGMATALLGTTGNKKSSWRDTTKTEMEGLFDTVDEDFELKKLDAQLAKIEGRHHPLLDANADLSSPKKIKKKKKNISMEESFLEILKGGGDSELTEVFDKIESVDEKKDFMDDLCVTTARLSLWSAHGRLPVIGIMKSDGDNNGVFKVNWVRNKNGEIFLKKLSDGGYDEIYLRGGLDKGGIFFIIKNPKDYLKNDMLEIPMPEIVWKVERRKNLRLKFFSWETIFVKVKVMLEDNEKFLNKKINDIGKCGIGIKVSKGEVRLFRSGSRLEGVEISISGRKIVCDLDIIWCQDIGYNAIGKKEKYIAGTNFVNISDEDQQFINGFVNEKFFIMGGEEN
ncbi:MAG: hypothetical protein KAQ98_08670 [Bacteriovoracaceae bacterium]|nr:hypothetical protein [Bacteriovoracaceae bacterium]